MALAQPGYSAASLPPTALGRLADATSIDTVYRLCAFLPALGILTAWLPDARTGERAGAL